MEKSEKVDLYKGGLLRRNESYIAFMASGETDLSLLPEPVTLTEKRLMELCKEKATATVFKPADSEHPDGIEPDEKPKEEAPKEEPKKKTSARRTTKK